MGLIQDVIKRMASNSFQIKAWAIALFSAIVIFSLDKLANQENPILGLATSLLLLVPILCFWYLDAFFLKTERLYRNLYKWVIEHRKNNKEAYLYNLNTFERETLKIVKGKDLSETTETIILKITNDGISPKKTPDENKALSTLSIMFSETIWRFYISPLLFVLLLLIYNTCKILTKAI